MTEFLAAHAVLWPVIIPLATAALAAALWNLPRAQKTAALAGVALMVAAAFLLFAAVAERGIQVARFGEWAPPFGIVFVADLFGALLVATSGLIAAAAMIFGLADIRRREQRAGFYPLLLGMLSGINGAFLTGDIFNLYVWFEIMLITAMGLLVIGRTRAQLDGALKYAALNLLSTIIFLMAVGILYGSTGTLNMADLSRIVGQSPPTASLTISALLLLCGFGIKAGYFPLFFWLPASYHTTSVTVSAVFAGLLTKVGVYSCFRVFTLIFSVEMAGLREIILVVAAGTMLFGVFGALTHWDIRRILGFQIISQIGYMLLGLALSTPLALASAVLYLVHDMVVKAGLFLSAGAIHRAAGTFDLRKAGGLGSKNTLLAVLFVILALSLAGIPPFSGFWGKLLVVDAAFKGDVAWFGALGLFVGLLNLFSMTRIWMEVFWKESPLPRAAPRRVPVAMLTPLAILAAATIGIGIYAEIFITLANKAAASLAAPAGYVDAVLGGAAPAEEP